MHVQPLLDLKTVADRLGISLSQLYVIMGRDELPSIKIGARRLIDQSDLAAFIDQRRSAPRLEKAALR